MAIESNAHWQQSESGLLVPEGPEKGENKNRHQHPRPATLGEDAMNFDYGKAPSEGGPVPSVGRPDLLGVASPLDDNVTAQMSVLGRAGLSGDVLDLQAIEGENPEAVINWLKEDAKRHCLILWQSPIAELARAMAKGVAPDEALAQWYSGAEDLISAVRRNRRQVTLVESTLASAHPELLAERLGQRFGLTLTMPADVSGNQGELDPVELLIAQRAVISNGKAHRVAQELQATSLPLVRGDEGLLPNPTSVWKSYRQRSQAGRADAEQLRAEYKKLKLEQQMLEQQLEESRMKAHPSQASEYQDLKEENGLLLLQLHQVQEELESYYLEGRDIRKKYEKVEGETKKLERERNGALQRAEMLQKKIDSMRRSRSWRLTKPLRASNLFKSKKVK